MIITMHSLFFDFVTEDGNMTTVEFTFPTKLPWTTRGNYQLSNFNFIHFFENSA